MANTYTQIFVHVVFAVKFRDRLITGAHREESQKYMTGIVQNHGHKLLAIACMPDHVHMLIGLKPHEALSDLVRNIKACSSGLANERRWVKGKFQWQTGFGGFSCGRADIDRVINYIRQQDEHHRSRRFQEEFHQILTESGIVFDERYIFRWDEDRGPEENG